MMKLGRQPHEGDWFLVQRDASLPDEEQLDVGLMLERCTSSTIRVFYPFQPDCEYVHHSQLLEYLGDIQDASFDKAWDRGQVCIDERGT